MSTQPIDVIIFDKSYRIESPATEQETLKQAAKYLDEKMKEIRQAAWFRRRARCGVGCT